MRGGLTGLFLLAAALVAAAPAGAARGPGAGSTGPIKLHLEGDRLSLELLEPVLLPEVLRAIGNAANFEVIVRKTANLVGPLAIGDLPLADVLRRLAARHSLILGYQGLGASGRERIVFVLLVGRESESVRGLPRRRTLPAAPTSRPTPPNPISAVEARNSRAVALRDIVKLSYRSDETAAAELQQILATSKDPKLRGAAVSALVGVGGEISARIISRHGLTDDDPQVRMRAAQTLWHAQGAGARSRLVSAAALERDDEVRRSIEDLLRSRPGQGRDAAPGPHPPRLKR
jgi:hypothetical protein